MDAYSQVADEQLDDLERSDPALYDAALTICEHIFDHPEQAQSRSRAIKTEEGIRMVLSVPGSPPHEVFWSTQSPRIEAVFPYSSGSR